MEREKERERDEERDLKTAYARSRINAATALRRSKPLFTVGDHVSARSARSRRRLETYQRAPYETHILE